MVSLNGYSYRSTVAAYGDVFMLPVSGGSPESSQNLPKDNLVKSVTSRDGTTVAD
jgi:hypothetical protein